MSRPLAVLLGAALLVACEDAPPAAGAPPSAGAPPAASASASTAEAKLDVVAPEVGLDGTMNVAQASFSSLSAMLSEDAEDGRITHQTTMVRVYLSDGPIAPGQPMKPGQHRIYFSLTGKKGSDAKTPLESGTYDAAAKHFERVAELQLERAGDDPKEPTMLVLTEATGTVRVSEHTATRVTGEIDVKQGDVHIRGRFYATPMPSGLMRH